MKVIKLFIVVAAIASFAFVNPENEPRKIKIVLDAGHGGNDHGAQHENYSEKEITAQIISKIHAFNKNENVEIQLTRLDDANMSLTDRTAMINRIKPDLVLSLHVNYLKNGNASGFEIYTSKTGNANCSQSNVFAKMLVGKLEKNLATNNRGIKEASFMILNKSESPAMVVELGFLSNANDRAYLTSVAGQDQIANTILEFISEME